MATPRPHSQLPSQVRGVVGLPWWSTHAGPPGGSLVEPPTPRSHTREEPSMNVIVGYRPTPEGRAALSRAVDEARRLGGARLLVINSAEQPTGSPEPISAEHGVDALAQQLAAAGIAHEIRQLGVNDDPAESIVSSVSNPATDLIVIGLRRRTPVGKLILGSVA